MGFRDDREALRARARAAEERARRAEREREELHAELERARADDAADEAEIRRLRERLRKLEPSAAPTEPGERKRRGALFGAFFAGWVLLVAGYAAFSRLSPGSEAPAPPPAPAEPEPAAAAAPEPRPPPSPLDRVRLGGVVLEAEGIDGVSPGDGCVVDRSLTRERRASLQVRCAGRLVFDSAESTGAGMTSSSGGVREHAAGDGWVVRTLSHSLTGRWTGPQAQIELDPSRRALRIWREGIDARDLRIFVETAAATRGAPLVAPQGATAVWRPIRARLAPDTLDLEPLGLADPEACELAIEPLGLRSAALTRALVRCGERILYGASSGGWMPAETADGLVRQAEDASPSAADGDPRFAYDGETVALSDEGWSATFRVEPHPACTLAGRRWRGAERAEEGTLRPGVVVEEGRLTRPDGRVVPFEEAFDCIAGDLRLVGETGETLVEGHFGPRFATFLGRWSDGTLLDLHRDPQGEGAAAAAVRRR